MSATNSTITRGAFESLDLTSGRADGLYPVSRLKVRLLVDGTRRSTVVTPALLPGRLMWVRVGQGGAAARKTPDRPRMVITHVQARRLCDLTELEAHREGIRVYAPDSAADAASEDLAASAYWALFAKLGPGLRKRWMRGMVHQELGARPTARDAFALLWDSLNRIGSWETNPWVWRYCFERITT